VTIANIGQMGSTSHASSATSVTHTTANIALAAGDFAVLHVATDNINTGSTDANNNEHTSVTGGTGTWTKIGEWANNNGGAGSGVTLSAWLFVASGTNAIGTVFTINFASAIVEKAIGMHGYSKTTAAGVVVSAEPVTNPITSAVDAANDFGSSAFSGLVSGSRLWYRALGKEANSTVDITPSTNFTVMARARSSTSASPIIVRGEYRINASTGETSNPTLAVSGDTAGLFVAIVESYSASGSPTLGAITTTATATVDVRAQASITLDAITTTGSASLPSSSSSSRLPFPPPRLSRGRR
jgi:hypothetical protein